MEASVVIPAYNAAATVAEAVASAAAQDPPPAAILVVDDGSEDGTAEVAGRCGAPVRVLRQANAGACAARNRGLAEVRTELVQFLDADDLLLPGKFAMQTAELRRTSADAVFCDYDVVDAAGRPVASRRYGGGDWRREVIREELSTPAGLHRAAAVRRVGGFRESLDCCQERDLHLRMFAAGLRLRPHGGVGVLVRRLGPSISSDYTKVLMRLGEILPRTFAAAEAGGVLDAECRAAFAAATRRTGHHLLKRGLWREAASRFAAASRMSRRAEPGESWKRRAVAGLLGGTWGRLAGPAGGAEASP